jgi:predicted transcriptional regulator/DNA-binding XRE family transcriptional regulator
MGAKTQHERIVIGLKIKQLRQAKGMSFSELSQVSGLSVSYLNEIEKGKKYPKDEKMDALLAALSTDRATLESPLFFKNLAPVTELLESNFLNELPLELYGIDLAKVVELIANAPTQVGAFISTLLDISRNYALREENFYFAALRSYLELNQNYFQELEDAAAAFMAEFHLPDTRPLSPETLARLLETEYGYTIHEGGLDAWTELRNLRAVFVPERKALLLNSNLSANQRAFQFGKELAFQFLKIQQRAITSSLLRGLSFEEVLNHARATYFSDALLLPLQPFIRDFAEFASGPHWDGSAFLNWMKRYGATPEMFYHRLTNILPKYFGLDQLFFMRFVHNPETSRFEVDRELHLSKRHKPQGNGLSEHYCRRWVSISLLEDLQRLQKDGKSVDTIVKAQRSRFVGEHDEYLCFTIARTSYPSPNRNVSVTLGLLVNDTLRRKIPLIDDPSITIREVGTTCERCPIADCAERAAPPVVVERRKRSQRIQQQLGEILGD